MHLLTDAHVKRAYVTALRSDGHTVERVVDVETLGQTAADEDDDPVLRALDRATQPESGERRRPRARGRHRGTRRSRGRWRGGGRR